MDQPPLSGPSFETVALMLPPGFERRVITCFQVTPDFSHNLSVLSVPEAGLRCTGLPKAVACV